PSWAGRAGVQDAANGDPRPLQRFPGTRLGEVAHTDHPPGLPDLHHAAERSVAGGKEWLALGARQLVGRQISPGGLHEDQRAVVGHEESLEEAFRGAEGVANPAPDAAAAHLGARVVEALDRAFRMLDGGLSDFPLDLQPVANDANLA